MLYTLVFLILQLKHSAASNFIDVGYSNSRNRREDYWILFMLAQCLLEVILTVPIIVFTNANVILFVVTFECITLIFSTLIDRIKSRSLMLFIHVVAELVVTVVYLRIADMIG